MELITLRAKPTEIDGTPGAPEGNRATPRTPPVRTNAACDRGVKPPKAKGAFPRSRDENGGREGRTYRACAPAIAARPFTTGEGKSDTRRRPGALPPHARK
ncbi:hypothetical protein GCM10010347_15590 [Streptomyces cirratus]|uniref:Uncharacterized protein n=1 Tax=Streptomyces cirratus TaxID=68187 RepID=A0ABQ3ER80_9ACTN|nr:hypothetical protein GCM10010347_15590 [Streptomyces cirratus]